MKVNFKNCWWLMLVSCLVLLPACALAAEVLLLEETMDVDPQANGWVVRATATSDYTISGGIMTWNEDIGGFGLIDYIDAIEPIYAGPVVVDLVWRADGELGIGAIVSVGDGVDAARVGFNAHKNTADTNQYVTIDTPSSSARIEGFSSGFITGKFIADTDNNRLLYWLNDGTHSASGVVPMEWGGTVEHSTVSIRSHSGCPGQIDNLKVSRRTDPLILGDTNDDGNLDIADFSNFADDWNVYSKPESEPRGLLAWWKFDEGSGSTVNDSSGNDFTGTIQGTGPHVWDASGGVYLDGFNNSDYVRFENVDISDNGAPYTTISYAFWAKGDVGTANSPFILWCDDPTIPTTAMRAYFPSSSGVDYTFQISQYPWDNRSPVTYTSSETPVESRDGQWHHWVVTSCSVEGVKQVYVDGVLKATASAVSSSGTLFPITRIMFGGNGTPTAGFQGYLKDLRIYNVFLTEGKVAEVMGGGQPSTSPEIAWWKFDEDSGSTVEDSSGNGWTGEVLGSGPHFWDPNGDGIYLDGFTNTDYVKFDNIDISDNGEPYKEISYAFWAKGDTGTTNSPFILWCDDPTIPAPNTAMRSYFPAASGVDYVFQISQYPWDNRSPVTYTSPETPVESRDGQWHHWVITRSSVTAVKQIYIDGVLKATAPAVSSSGTLFPITRIMFGGNGTPTAGFQGYLKDLRVYKFFLTQAYVDEIMTDTFTGPCLVDSFLMEDLNTDCMVDILDMRIMAENWLMSNL